MDQIRKETLWTKSYIMMIFGNLFIFMSFQMILPTLPPYIKSIGASGLEVGLVTTLFSIGSVLIRPYVGFMLQYRLRKPLVLIGAFTFFFITILYATLQIVLLLLIFRLMHGIAWGWSTTANSTAAADVIPNGKLGEGMGYYNLSATLSMIIAPSLGIYLFQVTTFTNLILIAAMMGLIAFALLSTVHYHTPEFVRNTDKVELKFSYFASFVEKSGWLPALITMMATFGYGAIITFIVIFGEERRIQNIFIFYISNAILATLSRPIIGKWFDKKGPYGIVIICSSLTFIGLWLLSFSYSTIHVAVAGMLFGLGFGSLMPTLQSWLLSVTPVNRRGVANGMYFSSIDLGVGLSGIVFGFIALFFETGTLYQISSLFYIATIVITFIEGRRNKLLQKQTSL